MKKKHLVNRGPIPILYTIHHYSNFVHYLYTAHDRMLWIAIDLMFWTRITKLDPVR